MPRAFAITAPTNSINLNDQGRGEVAFTVSNTSGGELRGRALVRALGSTQSDWLHILDESERDFDSQTVHQFTVEVAVPQGTPVGTYSFRLDVVSVEKPDDVYDEGPVIAFEVRKREEPAPKPFPWWIVVAVAGFVVVVGIAIVIMIVTREKVPSDRGVTVIPGTWHWDVDGNELGSSSISDLWWMHQTNTERYLVPENGARIAVVPNKEYGDVDLGYLRSLSLTGGRISGSDGRNLLQPGTVLALRTTEGNMAKLEVNRYYGMHDFEFDGAELLPENWRALARTRPNINNYHIEFEWTLYKPAQ